MPVLIHTGPQGRKSLRDFPLRLLVEGSAPQAPLNTEFHSVAARYPFHATKPCDC